MSDAASALPGVPPAPPAAPAAPAACLIQAVRLFKAYQIGKRRLEVLRGVSLSVARGEFVALCGASGSGKSTLLHLLGGLDTPDAGTVSFAGEDLSTASMANLSRLRNRKVGFVFQAYHLLPELDALENVSLPSRLAREPALAAERRARELLERVGLADRLEHKPYELSGGEQQRVAIARALMNSPELVLADEPTGNLDSHTGEGIMQLLRSLQAERQTTLLIATHDPRVAGTAPRVLELLDGQIAP
ncbi:MAG TPA: ABC transporter ATP-binding protein [Candidatus Saccharimonadales bacterium]|jgi:ABC-type lipoprotein export system ATPase subunit|nr:ABC transporter ATP-binding protein [Candidatus Saccharimonadales bacterium]